VISPLAARAIDEVRALHAFFVGWLRAAGPRPDFAEVERVLAPDFRMITPDGVARDRASVLAGLKAEKGSRPANFEIAILEPHAVFEAGHWLLLEFIEQQYRDGETTRRQSSALFTAEKAAPRGVLWRHLQETWMHQA
jgi:hypothetical protein